MSTSESCQICQLPLSQNVGSDGHPHSANPEHVHAYDIELSKLQAEGRVDWAFHRLPETHLLSSSFGVQSAVCLHLVTRVNPGIPVIFIDTGYHFPETYQFVDHLTQRLELNVKTYRNPLSPAWQESRFGQRWLQGPEGIDAYNRDNKVTPLKQALDDHEAGTWITGIRRSQAETRKAAPFLTRSFGVWKVNPIADWSDRDVHRYLTRHQLPYHPLWDKGYVSIGDVHSTRSLAEVDSLEQTRFFGLKRECGLHEFDPSDANQS